jgi:hypothetical protein
MAWVTGVAFAVGPAVGAALSASSGKARWLAAAHGALAGGTLGTAWSTTFWWVHADGTPEHFVTMGPGALGGLLAAGAVAMTFRAPRAPQVARPLAALGVTLAATTVGWWTLGAHLGSLLLTPVPLLLGLAAVAGVALVARGPWRERAAAGLFAGAVVAGVVGPASSVAHSLRDGEWWGLGDVAFALPGAACSGAAIGAAALAARHPHAAEGVLAATLPLGVVALVGSALKAVALAATLGAP